CTALCGKAKAGPVLADLVETHRGQHAYGLLVAALAQRDSKEAANRMFGRNIAGAWSLSLPGMVVAHNFQTHAVRIPKAEHLFLKPLPGTLHGNPGTQE